MSRILHNRMRSSLRKSTAWTCMDKRAVAFSVWTGRSMLLRKPLDLNIVQKRRYGILVARAVRGLLKIRYLVLGGAVTGGMTMNKKYSEWKEGLPDMGWINELLPDNDQWDRFTTTLISAKDKIGDNLQIGTHNSDSKLSASIPCISNHDPPNELKEHGSSPSYKITFYFGSKTHTKATNLNTAHISLDPPSHYESTVQLIGSPLWLASDPLRDAGLARAVELRSWLSARYEDAVAAAAANNDGRIEPSPKIVNNLKSKPAPAANLGNASAKDEINTYEKRIRTLQDEVLSVQARYQRELQRLEQENRELRQQNMLLKQGRQPTTRYIKRSLIDMYSGVLDSLSSWQSQIADSLPRVVVVGDQSAGKTSVLEMIARARIFPRAQGEMCTRAPVKVTLSEGPYHVAQFRDSNREFDLNKESECAELRKEIELRMRNSVRGGRSVSAEVISMSVRGPGLQRMVLVDLPGVISTQTVDMASDTRDAIKRMSRQYMENPNAIILCIQDGSVDAERSNVTDLVSSCDPSGKRTIFVLTKVDLAEENLTNPDRIRKILEGKLFPMKALGYYAVVTGRSKKDDSIQSIHEYEERFFRTSKLFKDGLISPSQVTTRNLSLAVADCFWRMVRATVEQQADSFKAMRFNLETEWKNTFPRQRELDRDELFERARAELLDQSLALSALPPAAWEKRIHEALWKLARVRALNHIYLPSAAASNDETLPASTPSHRLSSPILLPVRYSHNHTQTVWRDLYDIDSNKFNTLVDIKLREWAESTLPTESIQAGSEALKEEFKQLMSSSAEETDSIYEPLKQYAVEEAIRRHEWEERAKDVLRVLQLNALQDRAVTTRQQWDQAVELMSSALQDKLRDTDHIIHDLTGPGFKERWLYWRSSTEEQDRRAEVRYELQRLGSERPTLSYDEVVAVRDNLRRRGIEVDNEYIRETWQPVYLRNFLQRAKVRARDCKKSFYLYSQQNGTGNECCEVVMFWRIQQTLSTTSNALRQQICNREAARLDRELRDVLDEMAADPDLKQKLLSGRRVDLAEELKRVRQVQEKLEEFIEQLNKEK